MKITLEVEVIYIYLEKFIRILYDGFRGYSFSLKGVGSQEYIFPQHQTIHYRKGINYVINVINNVINSGIKNLSQSLTCAPLVPVEKLLQ